MGKSLVEGSVSRRLVAFMLPILAGNILQQLYNTVDAVVVGRYVGEGGLAAIGGSQPITSIIVALLVGMGAGSEILIGRTVGRNDTKGTQATVDTLFTSIMALSVVMTVGGYFGARVLLRLMHTPADVIDQAAVYLQIIMLGIPGIAGYNTLGGMIRSTGNSTVPLVFLAVCSLVNIGLDFLMVGVWGMGVDGAALATVASQTLSFLLCWMYSNGAKSSVLRYDPRHLTFSWSILKEGVRCGVPVSVQQCAMSVGMLLLQVVVNNMGSHAMTAYMIGSRIDSFAGMPITNIKQALTIFTSQNLAAGKLDRVEKGKRLSLTWAFGIAVVLLVILWNFGENLARFFGATGEETIRMTVDYVLILSLGYFAAGYYTVILGLISGTGNTFVPMVITITGYWLVRLPAAVLLGQVFGYRGVWSGILVGWGFCFIVTMWYYHSKKFRRSLRTCIDNPSIFS